MRMPYKESGIDKASELINAIGGLVNGSVPGGGKSAIPSFDQGGVAPKRELAIVDKGETMIPKDKMQSDISFHRSMHHLKKGGLHRALGVSSDKEIPKDMIEKATHSKNSHVKAMAVLAQNMAKWHKG